MKVLLIGLLALGSATAMASQYQCYYDYNRTEAPAVSIRHINLDFSEEEVILTTTNDGETQMAHALKSSNPNVYQVSKKDQNDEVLTRNRALRFRNIAIESVNLGTSDIKIALQFDLGAGSKLQSNYYSCTKI